MGGGGGGGIVNSVVKAAPAVGNVVKNTAINPYLGMGSAVKSYSDANGGMNQAFGLPTKSNNWGVMGPGFGGKSGGGGEGEPDWGGVGPAGGEQPWWAQGMPNESERKAVFSNDDGTLKDPYKLQATASRIPELDSRMNGVSNVGFANAGNIGAGANLAALNVKAYNPNLSQAAQAQNSLVDMNRNVNIDRNNMANRGALANARDDLAAGGGLQSGARERLAMSGARDRMMANAQAYGGAAQQKGQIAADDFARKDALQNQLPDMYMKYGAAQTDTDKFNAGLGMDKVNLWQSQAGTEDSRTMNTNLTNINNAMADKRAADDFKMEIWKQKNAAIGGEKTANAQGAAAEQASKKGLLGNDGGILGTGIKF